MTDVNKRLCGKCEYWCQCSSKRKDSIVDHCDDFELTSSHRQAIALETISGYLGELCKGKPEPIDCYIRFTEVVGRKGGRYMPAIKAVRQYLEIGLKEAKAIVDGAPTTILIPRTKSESREIVDKLRVEGFEAYIILV